MTPTAQKWIKRLAIVAGLGVVALAIAIFAFGRYIRAAVSSAELEILLNDAVYERRQAARGYDWNEIPPPVETIQNLRVRISGFDTDPTRRSVGIGSC